MNQRNRSCATCIDPPVAVSSLRVKQTVPTQLIFCIAESNGQGLEKLDKQIFNFFKSLMKLMGKFLLGQPPAVWLGCLEEFD